MDSDGPLDSSVYTERFGTWNDALREADLKAPKNPTRTELLECLQELAEELEKTPTINEMDDQGRYHYYQYKKKFGSWNSAVSAAGLKPNRETANIPDRKLLEELQNLADELNRPPSPEDMDTHGLYSSNVYEGRYDRWDRALNLAEIPQSTHPRWNDDKKWTSSRRVLIDELERLSESLNDTPRRRDIPTLSEYPLECYKSVFGSWDAALEAFDTD